jgi:putative ABC transport system permease protein
VPDYYDRLRETDVFEEQALYNGRNASIDQNGTPVRVRVTQATPSFFRLLRVGPALGRAFTEQDGEVGNDKKGHLSYALWQSQFGGDPAHRQRPPHRTGQPFTVVGVMPKGLSTFLNPDRDAVAPLAFTPQQKATSSGHSNNFQNIARPEPGRASKSPGQQIDALNARNLEKFPALETPADQRRFSHRRSSAAGHAGARLSRRTLYLMWGGALFVLLIGCVQRREPRCSCARACV